MDLEHDDKFEISKCSFCSESYPYIEFHIVDESSNIIENIKKIPMKIIKEKLKCSDEEAQILIDFWKNRHYSAGTLCNGPFIDPSFDLNRDLPNNLRFPQFPVKRLRNYPSVKDVYSFFKNMYNDSMAYRRTEKEHQEEQKVAKQKKSTESIPFKIDEVEKICRLKDPYLWFVGAAIKKSNNCLPSDSEKYHKTAESIALHLNIPFNENKTSPFEKAEIEQMSNAIELLEESVSTVKQPLPEVNSNPNTKNPNEQQKVSATAQNFNALPSNVPALQTPNNSASFNVNNNNAIPNQSQFQPQLVKPNVFNEQTLVLNTSPNFVPNIANIPGQPRYHHQSLPLATHPVCAYPYQLQTPTAAFQTAAANYTVTNILHRPGVNVNIAFPVQFHTHPMNSAGFYNTLYKETVINSAIIQQQQQIFNSSNPYETLIFAQQMLHQRTQRIAQISGGIGYNKIETPQQMPRQQQQPQQFHQPHPNTSQNFLHNNKENALNTSGISLKYDVEKRSAN